MVEFGLRRSLGHFCTAMAIGFIAAVGSEMMTGEWNRIMTRAVSELLSVNLLVTCLLMTSALSFGSVVCAEHSRMKQILSKGAFWAGRLCFDLGAASIGVMIGIVPLMLWTGGLSKLAYLSNVGQISLFLVVNTVLVRLAWQADSDFQAEQLKPAPFKKQG